MINWNEIGLLLVGGAALGVCVLLIGYTWMCIVRRGRK